MATQYKVKKGDTLSQIARKYGVGVNDISGYRSGNPDLIYPDELLNISKKVPSGDVAKNTGGSVDIGVDNDTLGQADNSTDVPDSIYSYASLGKIDDNIDEKNQEARDLKNEIAKLMSDNESTLDDLATSAKSKRLNELSLEAQSLSGDRNLINARIQDEIEGKGVVGSSYRRMSAGALRKNALKSYAVASQVAALKGDLDWEAKLIQKQYDAKLNPIKLKMDLIETDIDSLNDKYKKRSDILGKLIKSKLEEQKNQLALDRKKLDNYYKTEFEKIRQKNRLIVSNNTLSNQKKLALYKKQQGIGSDNGWIKGTLKNGVGNAIQLGVQEIIDDKPSTSGGTGQSGVEDPLLKQYW